LVHGPDSTIIKYLFNYKIVNNRCGFPEGSFNKIISTLENNKISFIVNYYDGKRLKKNYHKLNNYYAFLQKGIYNDNITNVLTRLEEDILKASPEKIQKIIYMVQDELLK
jgi:hypothetical protein